MGYPAHSPIRLAIVGVGETRFEGPEAEYPLLNRRYAEIIRAGMSDVDLVPLIHVPMPSSSVDASSSKLSMIVTSTIKDLFRADQSVSVRSKAG